MAAATERSMMNHWTETAVISAGSVEMVANAARQKAMVEISAHRTMEAVGLDRQTVRTAILAERHRGATSEIADSPHQTRTVLIFDYQTAKDVSAVHRRQTVTVEMAAVRCCRMALIEGLVARYRTVTVAASAVLSHRTGTVATSVGL